MLKNAGISRSLAAESMVLLKNVRNTLPLLGSAEEPVPVAVFGVGQIYTVKGGTGSGNVNNLKTTSFLEGLEECPVLKPDGLLARKYRTWGLAHENQCVEGFMEPKGYYNEEMPISGEEVRSFAVGNDAAIVILTRVAGEGADMKAQEGMIYLTQGERKLLDTVTEHFEKTILVLNTAGYLEITDYVPKCAAVLFMGLPGQDAGAAADVLTGKVLPSGHLTDTWPMRYSQYPTAEEYEKTHFNGNVNESMFGTQEQINVSYTDDIYVGYRYFDSFGQEVLYPFGYGLTYGKTELSSYSFAATGDQIELTATVENTGDVYAARQVLQVYLTCPQGTLEQPLQKLCAFGKTGLLAPGESETMSLSFRLSDFASFDEATYSYRLEKGHYYVRLGTDSRTTSVCGAVYLPTDVTTLVLSDRMGHVPEDFQTISPKGIPAITYPGEQEELDFAKAHAVRLSQRDFKTVSVKYRKPLAGLRRGRMDLRLSQVLSGECSLAEFTASMDASDLCKLVCGIGMDMSGMPEHVQEDADFAPPFNGILGGGGMKVPGAAGETADLYEKYGIPPITLADGPAGIRIAQKVKDQEGEVVRQQLCTAFPVGSLLACSWDESVLKRFGDAVAEEMLEYGVELWLAPGMNIHKNPLCGRNFEYFSEDPLVTGFCAANITQGVQKRGVGVTIKHFAGNNQEQLRTSSNDIVTQRALREIYLKGFELAVKQAQPFSIMTSYNDINGMPSANNYDLCTAICRDEWGFQGFIMTDWGGGISKPALSMCAGNDMIQPGGQDVVDELGAALASEEKVQNRGLREYGEKLTVAQLQSSAMHILGVILRCDSVKRLLRAETKAETIDE
jgi:beta-glucosidase